eukprot:537064-Hanusia_phi.AAC.1
MTTPMTRKCSDVTGSEGTCVQSGQYLYVLTQSWLTFVDAERFCNQTGRGGHLAHFPDNQTYSEVISTLGANDTWIGLRSEPGPVYDFRWTTGGTPAFTRWSNGPPNGGSQAETCLYVSLTQEWLFATSQDTYRVLCSYPIVI